MAQQTPDWRAVTQANLLVARKKNARIGSSKVRTGCLTCRTRRVKCDESRPSCQKCRKSNRACTYSTSPPASSSNASGFSLTSGRVSSTLALPEGDKRAFDFYIFSAAEQLGGVFDRAFWHATVLQIAHAEPLILDAILAISTLYETSQNKTSTDQLDTFSLLNRPGEPSGLYTYDPLDAPHTRGLNHYNRAISRVRIRVQDGSIKPLTAMLSCLLFLCLEIIRDNVVVAITLFQRGIEMLGQLAREPRKVEDEAAFKAVRLTFTRLSTYFAAFGHPFPMPEGVPAILRTKEPQARSFASIDEARVALFEILASSYVQEFSMNAYKWVEYQFLKNRVGLAAAGYHIDERLAPPGVISSHFHETTTHTDPSTLPSFFEKPHIYAPPTDGIGADPPLPIQPLPGLREAQSHALALLARWHEALKGFLADPNTTHVSPQAASSLLMNHATIYMWLHAAPALTEAVFDAHSPLFESVLHHAAIVLGPAASAASGTAAKPAPHFTFEPAVLPSLYLVAFKCRVPRLRQRALDLMARAPQREGVWGAEGLRGLVCGLVGIEEAGLGLPVPGMGKGKEVGMDGTLERDCEQEVAWDAPLPAECMRVKTLRMLRDEDGGLNLLILRAWREEASDMGVGGGIGEGLGNGVADGVGDGVQDGVEDGVGDGVGDGVEANVEREVGDRVADSTGANGLHEKESVEALAPDEDALELLFSLHVPYLSM